MEVVIGGVRRTRVMLCAIMSDGLYIDVWPLIKLPPYIQTITGRFASSVVTEGRKMLRVRQSSETELFTTVSYSPDELGKARVQRWKTTHVLLRTRRSKMRCVEGGRVDGVDSDWRRKA